MAPFAAMREFGGEALQDMELVSAGAQVGVRETRRVKEAYVLTEADAKEGRTFEDVVAWRSGLLDIGFVRLEAMKIHKEQKLLGLPGKQPGVPCSISPNPPSPSPLSLVPLPPA